MSEIHPKKIGQTANRFIQLRQKILLDKKTNQNLPLNLDIQKMILFHKNLKPGVTVILCSMIQELVQAKEVLKEINEV